MRAATKTAHRTIDLTANGSHTVVTRRAHESVARDTAIAAFRATRRRRFVRAAADTAADAAMATGGLAIVNVALRLDIGLPGGGVGLALGAGLLAIGASIALRRRGRSGGTDPASAAMPVRVIVLDDVPRTVIDLDAAHERVA